MEWQMHAFIRSRSDFLASIFGLQSVFLPASNNVSRPPEVHIGGTCNR